MTRRAGRASPPTPGSPEERRDERRDRFGALFLALAAHGLLLAAGNRATDAEPFADAPGAGPGGPQAVVALDRDAAERLLARLGPPAEWIERDAGLVPSDAVAPLAERSLDPPPDAERAPHRAPPPTTWPSAGPPTTPLPAERPEAAEPVPVERPAAPPERESVPFPTDAPPPAETQPERPAVPSGADGEWPAGPAAEGGDQAPLLDLAALDGLFLYRESPQYPVRANRLGHTGRVHLEFEVGPDGRVSSVRVERSSGHVELDRAALAAVRRWQLRPGALAERGLGPRLRIRLNFNLADR